MPTRKKAEPAPVAENARGRTHAAPPENPPAAPVEQSEADRQIRALEQGLRLFRESRFADAKVVFEEVAKGRQSAVTLTAKNHIAVCDRRMRKPALELETAEDHYNYAVERLNARDTESARKHLETALAMSPNCDYMLYAFAAALALSGDASGAYENLRRAIESDPRNRATARQDPDFAGVAQHPLFMQLLHPEKTSHPF